MEEECHAAGRLSKCQQQKLDGASFQGEMACLDSLLTKNWPKEDLQRLLELSTMSNRCTGFFGSSSKGSNTCHA